MRFLLPEVEQDLLCEKLTYNLSEKIGVTNTGTEAVCCGALTSASMTW